MLISQVLAHFYGGPLDGERRLLSPADTKTGWFIHRAGPRRHIYELVKDSYRELPNGSANIDAIYEGHNP